MKVIISILRKLFIIITIFIIYLFISQFIISHINTTCYPDYPMEDLSQIFSSDSIISDQEYKILFLQTGLGKPAIDILLADKEKGGKTILKYQQSYFKPVRIKCNPLCLWFVRTDILIDENEQQVFSPEIITLKPGDILLSFSTHSFGWRHGHAGIVLDDNRTLECKVIGKKSSLSTVSHWRNYSNYALLRVKNISDFQRNQVVYYTENHLNDIPYRLLGSMFFHSSNSYKKKGFGVNCSSLIWYAYDSIGIDLNSDGGTFITPKDILDSENIEVIQTYGLNLK